jgi:thiamine biosynthesis lipoprotein
MRTAVKAGLAAAEQSGGLVDPTLADEIEAAGYVASRAGVEGAPLAEALKEAPPRRPASPKPEARWRQVVVDDEAGTICRPPGLRLDTGGAGKGLAADLIAAELRGYSRFIVDCGGDIRIGGADALVNPYEVFVEHPLTGERAHVLRLSIGGVATSGLNVRIWRDAEGRFAHHLLDPASGMPAWTGLVGVTALGDTAVEAETLSKAALLSGPERGREVLAERGGLLVHDSGWVEPVGPLAVKPRVRLPEQAGRAAG